MAEEKGEGEYGQGRRGVDPCLAGAGYSVRPSDLRQVAQKLEQLEMALDGSQGTGVTHLATDAVHFNPSDLGGWIDSMLHELSGAAEQGHGSGESTLLSESVDAEDDCPGFELAEAAGFLEQDQNGGGLYGLLDAASTDEDDDEEETDRSLFVGIQDEDPSRDLLPSSENSAAASFPRRRERELEDLYAKTQSPSCSSASTGENFCKRARVERQSIEPQTSPQQAGNTNNCDNGLEDYVPNPSKQTAELFDLDHVAGSNPTEECTTSGVRLVHALMACADAIQRSNLSAAEEILKHVKLLAPSTGGAMAKVAHYFSEALVRRIYGFSSQDAMYLKNDSLSELLDIHFYETCPYLKFAHFTANQAILEAFQGHKRVHVIDFSLKQGIQWPALIQALALRPGGPPALRLTGIGPPQPDGKDVLHDVGIKLAQLADSVNVEFDFRGYVAGSLSDIKPWILDVHPGEALAVNSIFQLHSLLFNTNSPPIDEVLLAVRALNPKIVALVEQEASHNSPVFLERFTEALNYYATMFDSLEARQLPAQSYQQLMSEMCMARGICNIVACEGAERVERHETLMTWSQRMHNAGFRPLHLGSNAFKQASMLLTLFSGGEGYRVEENNGCLTLGWQSRPLIAVSAWQC